MRMGFYVLDTDKLKMALRAREKFPGLSRNGPLAFKWQRGPVEVTLFSYRHHCFCCVHQDILMLTMYIYMTKAEVKVKNDHPSKFSNLQ